MRQAGHWLTPAGPPPRSPRDLRRRRGISQPPALAWDALSDAAIVVYHSGALASRKTVSRFLVVLENQESSSGGHGWRAEAGAHRLWIRACLDPFGSRSQLVDSLRQLSGSSLDEPALWRVGSAAWLLDESDLAITMLQEAMQRLRAPGPQGASAPGRSERTVAEYLLAEVLDRQSDQARRLQLRTSILDRVNGELADLLTGGSGGERVLQQLEEAGALVVSLDAGRSWFRYHQRFADLLQLELRGSDPAELPALHDAAAGWYAEHGYSIEAVRHAQAARNWELAARQLSDHWVGLGLAGLGGAAHEFFARFPAAMIAADAELAAGAAGDQLARGSLAEAERYLALSSRALESVPAGRGRVRRPLSARCGCALPVRAATSPPRWWRRSGCWPPR